MKFSAQILFLILMSSHAMAGVSYLLNFNFRSRPAANNGSAGAAYDGMLWGEKREGDPLYGFYRIGARIGGSPTAAAFLHVAPVAPLVFSVEKGVTYRFLDSPIVNCAAYACQGQVERTDYTAKLGAAYNDFAFIGSAMWRELRTQDPGRLVYIEQEYFLVTPGFHRYFETFVLAGYQFGEKRMTGLLASWAELSEGRQKAESVYGFYSFSSWGASWVVGAGQHSSDFQQAEGFGAILLFSMRFGETLALF